MSSRRFLFTINNYTDDDVTTVENAVESGGARYLIYGKEIAPTTGTPHLQGYVEWQKTIRTGMCCRLLGGRAHLKIPRSTEEDRNHCRDYCKKDGDWKEFGVWIKGQGARADLDEVRNIALVGGMREVTRTYNYQQIKTAEIFLTYNEEPRAWKPEVQWFWGPTGTGKSKRAREELPNAYIKNNGTKWWPGYDGHEEVIIDDFRDSWWPITDMLAILDRYEYRFENKGGHRQFRAKKVIVTCAYPPERCYRNTGEAIDQLLRRIDKVVQFPILESVSTSCIEVGGDNSGSSPSFEDDTMMTEDMVIYNGPGG